MSDLISQCAAKFNAPQNTLDRFSIKDPFNQGNTLEGIICRQSGSAYGALALSVVNGEDVPLQFIYCTPKLNYACSNNFVLTRKYKFPVHKKVQVYEKLDGTNICQYFYHDANGKYYTCYKTRLTPAIINTKGTKPLDLWRQMLVEYPEIDNISPEFYGKRSFCYELYGANNLHMIKYDNQLSAHPLFSVSQEDASVYPPESFWSMGKDIQPVAECGADEDLINFYQKMLYLARRRSKVDGDYLLGSEGYIFYVLDSDSQWQMFKCKSELVENRNLNDGIIPQSVIVPTIWNAMETEDEVSTDVIVSLLKEEFKEDTVNESIEQINYCIQFIQDKLALKEQVLKIYQDNNLDIKNNKKEAMKCFAEHLDKKEMGKVFQILTELNL